MKVIVKVDHGAVSDIIHAETGKVHALIEPGRSNYVAGRVALQINGVDPAILDFDLCHLGDVILALSAARAKASETMGDRRATMEGGDR